MTTCWDVLGIVPGTDRLAIKRAYSKRLKITRPEDDPAAFQALYEAYQAALTEADWSDGDPATEDSWPNAECHAQSSIVTIKPENLSAKPISNELQNEIDTLLSRLDDLLTRPLQIPNPGNWTFLTGTPSLLDDEFRIELGREVIHRIVAFEQHNKQRKKHINEVSGAVITQLDDVYLWTTRPVEFSGLFQSDDHFQVLSRIDPEMKRAQALPMGGEVVSNYEAPKERDPAFKNPGWFTGDDLETVARLGIGVMIAVAIFFQQCSG